MGDIDIAAEGTARGREADAPRNSLLARFGADRPLKLDAGVALSPFQIAYKTYGTLNADRSNAVLICHALTGDQHAASENPVTRKPGWWETMVGPGRPIDTERYFVICPNVMRDRQSTSVPTRTTGRNRHACTMMSYAPATPAEIPSASWATLLSAASNVPA